MHLPCSFGLLLFATCFVQFTTADEAPGTSQRYDGYKLYRVVPRTSAQLTLLQKLRTDFQHDAARGIYKIDIWTEEMVLGQSVSILVAPSHEEDFTETMRKAYLETVVAWANIQDVMDKQTNGGATARANPFLVNMTWDSYHRYPTMELYFKMLERTYPELVKLTQIGLSYEGRALWMLKLGKTQTGKVKPAIWLDSGIHAREWISSATVTYMINELVTGYGNASNTWLLDDFDWYIMPMVNPDGFEYTHTTERLFRKTRRIDPTNECVGVDANRNYDFMWQTENPSFDACSNTYGGSLPYSEPENMAVSEAVLGLKNELKVFITFHAYGQYWMTPYGYTFEYPPDYADMYELGVNATTKLQSFYGTTYRVGTSADVLYTSSGTSRDFAKGRTGTKYVYTVELRDKGDYQFLLPPEQILPTGIETFAAVQVVAARIRDEFAG